VAALMQTDISAPAKGPLFRLDGLDAAVVGANHGLGQAATAALAGHGAHVHALVREARDLDTLRAAGPRANVQAIRCDDRDAAEVGAFFAGLPHLDVLVNVVEMVCLGPCSEVGEAELDLVTSGRIAAAFRVARAAAGHMLGQGGSIVTVIAQSDPEVDWGTAICRMARHALDGLTRGLATELAPRRVRVNLIEATVAPPAPSAPKRGYKRWIFERMSYPPRGTIDDVVGAILFFASPQAAFVTGTNLVVDGGWAAR